MRLAWTIAAGAAVLAAAAWLRAPTIPYLVATAAATIAAAVLVPWLPDARRWPVAFAAVTLVFCALATASQRTIVRVDDAWERYAVEATTDGETALVGALGGAVTELRGIAERALDAPREPTAAFRALAPVGDADAERGVVLFRDGQPAAWGGRVRVLPDIAREPVGAVLTPFYVTLYAVARRGGDSAVATAVVHASPPADRLASAIDRRVTERTLVRTFEFAPPDVPLGAEFRPFAPRGATLFQLRAAPLVREEVLLRAVEWGRARGVITLAAAALCFLAAAWRGRPALPRRLAALGVAVMAVGIVPLNSFSNVSALFDPSYYYVPLGGPFTATVGALGLTSAFLLLGLLTVLRAPSRYPSRMVALGVVLSVALLGPFLLRDLARGIAPPAWGVTARLWVAWEITIFLAATAVLLAGASAGRAALGQWRGLPPSLAPLLAAGAALVGPVLWEAPGRWPAWYPALWVAAIGALALTRRSRGFVLTAALVAGFGSATLVWGTTVRKRVELARRDVAGLSAADPYARTLLERFAMHLTFEGAPRTRAELLLRYMTSDLAPAEYPVSLAAWSPDGTLEATLETSAVDERGARVAEVAALARRTGAAVLREAPGAPGVHLVLAVPHTDGTVTTAVVAPRTRLIPDDPFAALLGLRSETPAEPPYTLSLADVGTARRRVGGMTRWTREGDELHGDGIVPTATGPARAHVEVELRSLDALIQRGALVVLVDVAIVALLWALSAVGDGGLARWLRGRRRLWTRSYRTRLTLVLFAFFVVPAVVFVAWSYRRLQSDDRQSRGLLVRETLRAVRPPEDFASLGTAAERLDSPLLLYADGRLVRASDPLYDALAPTGRFLPPPVQLAVGLGDEVSTSYLSRIGGMLTLFGYRVADGAEGARLVLAAPARTDELALDQRRRDLGVLVLFSAVLGAFAALWLSGVAAREFARPIGALRRAALAVAAGEREPTLSGEPPLEFLPVFSAFRRMAADLSASQLALEEARRRTETVLRNVASGVLAVDGAGVVTLANPRAEALLDTALAPGTPLVRLRAPEIARRITAFVTGTADEEEFDAELGGRQLHGRLTRLARGGAVITLDDVTELARAQRVLAWGEMARQVAHEIKNPLTPIRLGVQHLRRAHADRRADFDHILQQNAERILVEIDRLDEIARSFSRYGTAPAERAPSEPTDVAAVVRDVVELERMGEGALRWDVQGADAPAFARARRDELREVLLNLLENARLAGASTVGVAVTRADGRVVVVVEDDGGGIAPDVLPRIFEPHFSTRTSGSGLGLAVSRRLVDGWGGVIGVESTVGEGTRVELTLVAATAAN